MICGAKTLFLRRCLSSCSFHKIINVFDQILTIMEYCAIVSGERKEICARSSNSVRPAARLAWWSVK